MIAFQRSGLPANCCTKKEAVSPQTIFCGGGAGTKWRSGYARLVPVSCHKEVISYIKHAIQQRWDLDYTLVTDGLELEDGSGTSGKKHNTLIKSCL